MSISRQVVNLLILSDSRGILRHPPKDQVRLEAGLCDWLFNHALVAHILEVDDVLDTGFEYSDGSCWWRFFGED